MVRFSRQRLIRNLPTWGGGGAAVLAAAFVLVLPEWRLESVVSGSGLPAILPFAAPPLGLTARALLVVAGAALAGAVGWSTLFLIWGPGGWLYRPEPDDTIVVRRADAHPDAPPRRPLSVADLGVPPPPSVRPIPADLDQPLAAFHPAAIPDVPREPVWPIPPIAPEPGPEMRRIETFELTPMVRPAPRWREPDVTLTVEALLERLERGTQRRSGAAA